MLGFAKILPQIHLTKRRQRPTGCMQSIDLFYLDCNVFVNVSIEVPQKCKNRVTIRLAQQSFFWVSTQKT